jgi:protein-tyrosine-phosphatase/predicted ATP-grasp superfamily ATP-dependent carboligase
MQADSSRRVLVLDADTAPALGVVRSLRRQGLQLDIGSAAAQPICQYSRGIAAHYTYPDPMTAEADFIAWIKQRMAAVNYDLVIPVTERSLVPLSRHRGQLDAARLALPDSDSLEAALDKSRTMQVAESLGIPVPSGVRIDDPAQLADLLKTLTYPVVVKPERSMGADMADMVQLSVSYALDEKELLAKTTHYLRFGAVLLQEYFRGQGIGIELIADHGKVIYAFQHLRLHEVPLTGGGSSLRMSVPIEPVLLDAASRLMQALSWHGVAMVEFKWQPDDASFRLMEINGRFWGSLPLSIAAGADFPAMLFELLTQGQVQPRAAAKPDVYCRKLGHDLYWHELVARRDAPPGLVTLPTRDQVLRDLGLVFSLRHHFDVQQWRDPLPGLVDIWRIAAGYGRRLTGLWHERRLLAVQRAAWRNGEVGRLLARSKHPLFVCYGNINRSALAERIFVQMGGKSANPLLSAGFHEEAARPADPNMVDVAARHSLNMDNWASRHLDRDMVERADIIFVMEKQHLERMRAAFPDAMKRTFLLGLADESSVPNGEIADPYGRSTAAYERCYAQVSASMRQVIDAMR